MAPFQIERGATGVGYPRREGLQRKSRGRVALRVSLDSLYEGIVDECVTSIGITLMGVRPNVYPRPDARMVHVVSPNRRWLDAFPQHGPGCKHLRPIVLEDWQCEIVE